MDIEKMKCVSSTKERRSMALQRYTLCDYPISVDSTKKNSPLCTCTKDVVNVLYWCYCCSVLFLQLSTTYPPRTRKKKTRKTRTKRTKRKWNPLIFPLLRVRVSMCWKKYTYVSMKYLYLLFLQIRKRELWVILESRRHPSRKSYTFSDG